MQFSPREYQFKSLQKTGYRLSDILDLVRAAMADPVQGLAVAALVGAVAGGAYWLKRTDDQKEVSAPTKVVIVTLGLVGLTAAIMAPHKSTDLGPKQTAQPTTSSTPAVKPAAPVAAIVSIATATSPPAAPQPGMDRPSVLANERITKREAELGPPECQPITIIITPHTTIGPKNVERFKSNIDCDKVNIKFGTGVIYADTPLNRITINATVDARDSVRRIVMALSKMGIELDGVEINSNSVNPGEIWLDYDPALVAHPWPRRKYRSLADLKDWTALLDMIWENAPPEARAASANGPN